MPMTHDPYPSRCHSSQAGVLPRRDPVVYGKWHPDAPLTQEQTRHFEDQGYLVLRNVFSSEEIACLQDEAQALLADPAALDKRTVITEPGVSEIRSIFRIHFQSGIIARMVADERLAGAARFLLDDEIYVHQSRLNYKPGFHGKEFYWHSDFETWHVEDGMPRMRALSMSVLLSRNTALNGPLMLIPGSHRKYITCAGKTPENHYLSSLKKQEYGVPDEQILAELVHESEIVAPVGDPGTVILFDCNLMHGSNSNITPFPRANAFVVYNAVSNHLQRPYGAQTPRPDFIASRECTPVRPARGALTEIVA